MSDIDFTYASTAASSVELLDANRLAEIIKGIGEQKAYIMFPNSDGIEVHEYSYSYLRRVLTVAKMFENNPFMHDNPFDDFKKLQDHPNE